MTFITWTVSCDPVMAWGDGVKNRNELRYEFFSFRKYVSITIKLFIIYRRVSFSKTRFKANISVKHCVDSLLVLYWCCRYWESSWEMTLSIFPSGFTAFNNQIPVCRRNDNKGIKDMVWKFVVPLPLRFNTFWPFFKLQTTCSFLSFFINSASMTKNSSPCLILNCQGLK
jgi:hypothetical protein